MAAHMPTRGPLDCLIVELRQMHIAAGKCSVNVEMENPESCEERAGRLSTLGRGKVVPLFTAGFSKNKILIFGFFSARGLSERFGLATPGLE